jgi:hypothetical protein
VSVKNDYLSRGEKKKKRIKGEKGDYACGWCVWGNEIYMRAPFF